MHEEGIDAQFDVITGHTTRTVGCPSLSKLMKCSTTFFVKYSTDTPSVFSNGDSIALVGLLR